MRGVRRLVAATGIAAAAAGAAIADLAREDPARTDASLAFQGLVGGLGTGPALDHGSCAAEVDAREDGVCPEHVDPLPAGGALCPWLGRASARRR